MWWCMAAAYFSFVSESAARLIVLALALANPAEEKMRVCKSITP